MFKVVRIVETNNRYGTERVFNHADGLTQVTANNMARELNKRRRNAHESYEARQDVYA